MYYQLSSLVKTPETSSNGRTVILSNGYVYWITKSWWDKSKQRTLDDRVLIGKICEDNKTLMHPNKKYESIFGPIDPVVNHIRNKIRGIEDNNPGLFHFSLSYGLYVITKEVSRKIGLTDALMRSFPELYKKIFALNLHAISNKSSTAQEFSGWAFHNYCGLNQIMDSSQISKLYKDIGENEEALKIFFQLFRVNFMKVFYKNQDPQERVIAVDSTNQVTESNNQPLAKRGKSKTGEKLPIIQTVMLVDEKTGIPIWYEHFSGNILDKTQTPNMVEKVNELGYQDLFLMMDSGYYSEEVINALMKNRKGFAMMVPDIPNFVDDLIKNFRDQLKLKEQYFINQFKIYAMVEPINVANYDLFAYVYYDDQTARNERDAIHGQYDFFLKEVSERVNYTEKMKDVYARRGIIVKKTERDPKTGKNFKLEKDIDMLQKLQDEAGFFVILSNRKMKADEIIAIARERDKSEKAFAHMKSHFDLSRTYVHSDAIYKGKMFVAFCSLIELQALCLFEKDYLDSSSSENINTLILEMNKYTIQRKADGTWYASYAMNKDQKNIIKALALDELSIAEEIRGIKLNLR